AGRRRERVVAGSADCPDVSGSAAPDAPERGVRPTGDAAPGAPVPVNDGSGAADCPHIARSASPHRAERARSGSAPTRPCTAVPVDDGAVVAYCPDIVGCASPDRRKRVPLRGGIAPLPAYRTACCRKPECCGTRGEVLANDARLTHRHPDGGRIEDESG